MTQPSTDKPLPMKNWLKAGLLSGLVGPGAGHIVLKSYVRGSIYAALSLLLLVFILGALVPVVQEFISTVFESSTTLPNLSEIRSELWKIITHDDRIVKLFIVLTVLWLIALIDAVIVGRNQDRKNASNAFKV